MIAKQIRLNKVLVSSSKLSFKGFILKLDNNIVDVDFTVVKGSIPDNGSLTQFIIKPNAVYDTLPNIEFSSSKVHSDDFEIIVELNEPVEFDNIQCVCGDNENYHFTNMVLSYKPESNSKNWIKFNRRNSIPEFIPNGVGVKRFKDIVFSTTYGIFRDKDGNITSIYDEDTATNAAYFVFVGRSHETFKTGKHFVEITLENSDWVTASSNMQPLALSDELNPSMDIGAPVYRNFFSRINANGPTISHHINGVDTDLETYLTTGYPNNTPWPEYTVAFLVDLDERKIKMVYNGVYESNWHDIPLDRPDQAFYFSTAIRNGGRDFKYSINYPPKYEYHDLTPDYKTDHFLSTEGWVRNIAVTVRESSRVKNRSYIEWPHTLKDRGILREKVYYQNTRTHIWRIPEHAISQWGYGYFKGTVLIDYPPKEPTSKRVLLYSIRDNAQQQITWSNPLTGEYEFKYVKMDQPYLIFTYDSDEDFNAKILGPVYPTLMPEFIGKDLSIKK